MKIFEITYSQTEDVQEFKKSFEIGTNEKTAQNKWLNKNPNSKIQGMRQPSNWIEEVEMAAEISLKGKMNPFPNHDKRSITCPWFQWRREYLLKNDQRIDGIIFMQDWWNKSEGLEKDMEYLNQQMFEKETDRTIFNIYNVQNWNSAIWQSKKWIVMNAVWGLRIKEKQCGYLGANIHKSAFLVWSRIVAKLSHENEEFKAIFAGDWARFQDGKNEIALKEYLNVWKTWSTKNRGKIDKDLIPNFEEVKGKAFLIPHPATWKTGFDYSKGPPPRE